MVEMNQFYENLLGLKDGWAVESVNQNNSSQEITVKVTYTREEKYLCPKCGRKVFLNDWRERTIQHLDTCEYKTYLVVKYPRVKCPLCGTQAIIPPFAAANSRFTKVFERRIIELCHSSNVQKVARDLDLNWHVVAGIKERALKRGLKRQRRGRKMKVYNIGVDETSYQKNHSYSTIISDMDRRTVLAAFPGKDSECLINWFNNQNFFDFTELKSISMDMSPAYLIALRAIFPNANELICFDRFHIAQMFCKAVDSIRMREQVELEKKGENVFERTRFDWLRNSERTDNSTPRRRNFLELTKRPYKTTEAWRLKERASKLWDFDKEDSAKRAWKNLLKRLTDTDIGELKKLAKSIQYHLAGILNAIKLRANNGLAEARNSCIQRVKYMACGYRNKTRFNLEIIFQWGGLNMAF